MPLDKETFGQAVFPVAQEENSPPEQGTERFWQEGGGQNEVLSQEMFPFLDFNLELEIQCEEIVVTSNDLDPIPQENKESSEAENDGFLMLEELEQYELFPEINQFLMEYEDELQIQSTKILNPEQDPTPGPSSGENKDDLNLEENNHRGKEKIKEAELQRKSSAPSKSGSNNIKKPDYSGKCCECNKVYLHIFNHSRRKHNGKLEKCTASRDCKKYFASVQKRVEHEQQHEHQERKEFQCQFCHYSTEDTSNLNKHVRRKHTEKKIRCGQQKCGKMFASEVDLRDHVKMYHKMEKCLKCGREMSLGAIYRHNRYRRCPGTAAE